LADNEVQRMTRSACIRWLALFMLNRSDAKLSARGEFEEFVRH